MNLYDSIGTNMTFQTLKGKKIIKVELIKDENDDRTEIHFYTKSKVYRLYHEQSCCEHVIIEDINGDLTKLVNETILFAEESSNSNNNEEEYSYDSATWTFYKIGIRNEWIDIRWLGQSNGYYSECVNFTEYDLKEMY